MLIYINWDIHPEIFNIGSFAIRYYSLLFVAGLISNFYLLKHLYQKENIKIELLDKLFVYVGIGTVAGARIGHCLFYEWSYYKNHLLEIFLPMRISGGDFEFTGFQGLASHGAIIGIILSVWLYSKVTKQNILKVLDKISVVGPLAGASIRFGNLMNSEIVGKATDMPWGFVFTLYDDQVRHPAQLYEALAYLLTFALMWWSYKKYHKTFKSGFYLSLAMILIFTARFFIEFIKENQEAFENDMVLNMGQWLSIPVVIVGLILVVKRGFSKL